MRIETWPVDRPKPYPNNPRINDDAVKGVADSIQAFGWQQPIVVDSDGVVIVGHTRLKAAKLLGLKEVPVTVADDLTPDEVAAYRLADNRTAEKAAWDMDALKLELKGIELDMSPWFDKQDLSWSVGNEQEIVEDEPPEEAEPRAKRGDVWQLGRHRVMCGDSTSADDVAVLMDGNRADMLLTDPPYGVKAVKADGTSGGIEPSGKGSTHRYAKNAKIPQPRIYREIIGDDTTETAKKNYEIMRDVTETQIIFGGNYFTDFLPPSRCWIVWDKRVPRDSFFAQVELAWVSKDGNALIYEYLWSGLCREGSREIELPARVHPTQKPVGLFASIIGDFTDEGGTVVDCFGGSGTTLIAAEQLGRTCYMMELDPHYVDVIIERWEQLTGGNAVRVTPRL